MYFVTKRDEDKIRQPQQIKANPEILTKSNVFPYEVRFLLKCNLESFFSYSDNFAIHPVLRTRGSAT
jgi:hypothetical protein